MLPNKVAVVTGAASGIGLATTERFVREGFFVVMADIQSPDQASGAINDAARNAVSVAAHADISDADAVDALFAMVRDRFGRLDVLVNNAGVVRRGALDALSISEIDLMLSTNLRGTILCSRSALELLRRAGNSAIVNVASELGIVGASELQVYCASKGGIIQLTRAMAVDHAKEGIRVNCVCPGPVLTPFIQERIDTADDPDAKHREYAMATVMERIGLPEEIASVVYFAASGEASFMTGSVLMADGGATAQ